MAMKLIMLAVAGAAGTLARYLLQKPFEDWAIRVTGLGFPWGTLPINAAGCFLFGLVWALSEPIGDKTIISGEMRLIVLTGFLGAFTTFSTFGFETGRLIQEHRPIAAAGNVLAQCGVGIVLALAGIALGRLLAARVLGA